MRKNFKKYISIILVVCMVVALASLTACGKKNEEPEETSANTTQNLPIVTSVPKDTETTEPEESTYPADSDPKQEDVFFD